MKTKFTRVMALVLTLVMCFSTLNITTFAVEQSSAIQIVEQGGKVYYLAEPQEGEVAGEDNFDVWTSKTIAGTKNEDEFEVTLQVGTTIKAIPNDVAVVLVIDTSTSMMADEDGNTWHSETTVLERPADKKARIEYAREAALEFSKSLVEGSGVAKRMLSIVEFGNNAYTVLPWTNANNDGELSSEVKNAIEEVDVSFKYDNKSYWNEEAAIAKWGRANYWDANEYAAVMKDESEDKFSSYFSDCFKSFVEVTEVETETEDGTLDVTEVSICTFGGCENSSLDHKHCAVEGCCNDIEHKHCLYPECEILDPNHKHCDQDGCEVPDLHKHCAHEDCEELAEHQHCKECGKTEEHVHVVGCTLSGCKEPDNGPHIHACVHGGDSLYPYYNPYAKEYNYRCLNSDPFHTHDVYDGDSYYTLTDHELQKYRTCGTNLEGGLRLACNLLNDGLAENGKIHGIDDAYVILLSDGMPSWYTDESSADELGFVSGKKGGNVYAAWSDLTDIIYSGEGDNMAIAEDIKDNAKLYAIMYGLSMKQKLGYNTSNDKKADHVLAEVNVTEWFENKNNPESGIYNYIGADEVIDCPESKDLTTAFFSINDRIDVLAKAWTVTDELSDDVTFGEFKLNGDYAGVDGTSVDWSLGRMMPESGDGSMANPYIYTLKYTVKLKSAKDNVKEISLAYDANSDSVVSLPGVWTGTNTQLQYLMLEKEQLDTMTPDQIQEKLRKAAFEDVSVKGLYADYEFIKKNKETDEIIEGAGFTLYDADGKVYGSEVFSDSEGKVTFTDIPKGEYTMKETTAPSGMQQMSDLEYVISWGMITAKNGREMDDVIYNIPIPIPGKINIFVEKVWNDSNDVNGKRPESITVQLMANGNAVSDKTLTLNAGNNWSGSFDNLDEYEGDIEIVYTIAEVEVPEGYESVITGDAETGFTVTNTYVTVEEDPTEPEETEPEEIPDEDVPMADVPKTGDPILQYVGLAITSGVAAILVGKIGKKKEDEE